MTLEIGTRLGHYRILALLGRGGMADVYTAEDERLGREVALKAVPPEFARDPERVERFRREVRAAARLSHPNIVTVYEFGQGDGLHFYTMALMPGGDLKALIRANPEGMAEDETRAVASAVARALNYAHRHGFVHRDVKPENILFGEEGTPQLTDFGIARVMGSETRMTATGMSIGSPHYMSPEQARGLAVDGRSDLYSLGVVLYEMLTGRLPFNAADTFAVAYSHINDPVPELPRDLAGWQPVVERLLAKSPEDRYATAGELAQVLAAEALPPPPATRVVPVRQEVESKRRLDEGATRVTSESNPVLGGDAFLVVETTPSGAQVLVDDQPVGKTPLERSDIRAGMRAVTLLHPHYETVHLADRKFEEGVVLRLERVLKRRVGRLTVMATPRQAWVEVAGKRMAEATPVTLEDLPAGRVRVRLGAPDHRPSVVEVEIPNNGLVRLERELEPIAQLAPILEPESPVATVTIGQKFRVFDGMEFVWVPAGEFLMGWTSHLGKDDEKPVTRVRISHGFWMGKYQVTQAQWQAVMGNNPSRFKEYGSDCPVENVSWNDVGAFLRKLNESAGGKYRLPTEAEWEYTARAGTETDTYAGNITEPRGNDPGLNRIGWYDENSSGGAHPVGQKSPNAFGLHDMLGNVWEWVGDWYGAYPGGAVTNPKGPASGSSRVARGGSWGNFAWHCRSALRRSLAPENHMGYLGFRLLRTE